MPSRPEAPERETTTCAVLLSDKSSGSSVLQSVLAEHDGIRLVQFTRHKENETLYWVKAAATLGLPQPHLADSELPLTPEAARRDLVEFLEQNLARPIRPDAEGDWLFDGWLELCRTRRPIFLEKSPHHLHCWTALELLMGCADRASDVEFRLVGLTRNPMDTLYSKWRRWRQMPERSQYEWLQAYRNLQRLAGLAGERLRIVRYEDLVADPTVLDEIRQHLGLPPAEERAAEGTRFHDRSLARWRKDPTFGFRVSPEVMACALDLGYEPSELLGNRSFTWPLRARVLSGSRRLRRELGGLWGRTRKSHR